MKTIFNPRRVILILAALAALSVLAACSSGSSAAPSPATPEDWTLQLTGTQSYSMTEAQFQEGALHHPASYSDASGAWSGMPLWRLVGWVDGDIQHGSGAFNDALADTGYTIKVSSADGSYQIFNSATIKRNDNIIVANRLNGQILPAANPQNPGEAWHPRESSDPVCRAASKGEASSRSNSWIFRQRPRRTRRPPNISAFRSHRSINRGTPPCSASSISTGMPTG